MYRNRIIDNKCFFVAFFAGIIIAICASDASEIPPPKNDFVLRSCMSSVELNRRNIGVPVRKLSVALERPSGRIAASTLTRLPLSRDRIISADMKNREKTQRKSIQQRLGMSGRPSRLMVAETPLRTLFLQRKSRHEGPQLFVRNDQLPEVRKSSYRGESHRNEAAIISIQSA